MSLHFKLCSIRKRDLGMHMYISKVKEICDELASCGIHVSTTEHIASTLNGLPTEHRLFVAMITASREPFTLGGVMIVLVDAEAQQAIFESNHSMHISAHNVQLYTESQDASQRPYRQQNVNCGRGRNRYQCQLCGKVGHLANRCSVSHCELCSMQLWSHFAFN